MTDPWEDPTAKRWVEHVLEEMVPKMANSAMVVQLVPTDGEGDVKFWVELGAAICMNKPILAVVLGAAPIPPKLELVADEIVRCPEGMEPSASTEIAVALKRMRSRLEGEE